MSNLAGWESMVVQLLADSHMAQAEEVPSLIRHYGMKFLGITQADLYLADYQQTCLMPVETELKTMTSP